MPQVSGQPKASFWTQVAAFPANFWVANGMELLERLAFFGVRAVAPLFLVKSAEENGLGLAFDEKGYIYMWWALLQCLIPMVSGGYTDRYGYRKSLVVAFTLNIAGYIGMANSKPIADALAQAGWPGAGYWVFLLAACFVATGTAIFKPPVQGVIAKATDERSSSVGWGLFYWVVNIGGALAPMLAAPLRGQIDWHYVFYGAALVTSLNFLPALLLFREPEAPPGAPGEESQVARTSFGVFVASIRTIFHDPRLIAFLLIFSCFWLMFMQLWDLLPNFIDEWVDTSDVAPGFAWASQGFGGGWVLENGQTKPEMIININSWSIILLVLPISWLIGRINKVAAMVVGMTISLVGFVGCGLTTVGLFVCACLLVFSIGEMTCSPTFNAYVALIAPPDKKALYMGYANIPFAIGWAAGNGLAGVLYERLASKVNLARHYLREHLGMDPQAVAALDKDAVLAELAARLPDAGPSEATRLLWETYAPQMVWIYLGLVGLAGTLGMVIFYQVTRRAAARRA